MSGVTSTPVPSASTTKGMEGIVATNSSICYIDGDRGVLAYRGIDIHELADHSSFEETCYLLWFGRLPKRGELSELRERLGQERHLDPAMIQFLRDAPRTALPMDVLRTAVSALAFYDADDKKNGHEANVLKAIRLTSQIAMIVAAYNRIRKGRPVVEADRSISHAANFLLQMNGSGNDVGVRGASCPRHPFHARNSLFELSSLNQAESEDILQVHIILVASLKRSQ